MDIDDGESDGDIDLSEEAISCKERHLIHFEIHSVNCPERCALRSFAELKDDGNFLETDCVKTAELEVLVSKGYE